ncbi:hypothetical protein ACJJTC_010507 [Scirpophaga incertulas]
MLSDRTNCIRSDVSDRTPTIPSKTQQSGTTPAATESAATTSRRRPVLRREREVRSLNSERINTLLQCNTRAEEENSLQMKILQLQEEREKEILKQERLKTKQELKLEILKIQLENLKK